MFVPRQRAGFHIPDWLLPLTLTAIALTATVLAWAAFAARPTSNGVEAVLPATLDGNLGSIAYALREDGQDNIYVRPAGVLGTPRLVASFRPFQPSPALHVRGAASPGGDQVAILSAEQPVAAAALTFVNLPGGELRRAEGAFRQLSEVAWTRDGLRVAAVRPDGVTVVEVDAATLAATTVAVFGGARQALPVGYSANGTRLFVVVIDQAGSALWAVKGGQSSFVAALSAGMTTGWTLSPDGSRLAFVDVVGVGPQRYAGRTLMIATGRLLSAGAEGDQLGAAWRPDSDIAGFGGPGGSFAMLAGTDNTGSYVVPVRWSPDGRWLVASIVSGTREGAERTVELVMPGQPVRVRLANAGEPVILGFVRDDQ